jgi:hypothetical protein
MSDTPRTDAAEYESQDEPAAKLGAVDAEFARTLERELNSDNTIIRQQQLLEEENLRLQERIKRLEDVLQTAWYLIANVDWETGKHSRLHKDFLDWRDKGFHAVMLNRAKEAKP